MDEETKCLDGVPEQSVGNELSIQHAVEASSIIEVNQIYKQAVERLLDVNHWHKLTDSKLSTFELTDETGKLRNSKHPKVNNFFRIKIPAPGSEVGDGYDWVKVEMLEHQNDLDTGGESMTLRVRPVANPLHAEASIAHFFNDDATSTFKVLKKGLTVTAAVYGRNEVPNTDGTVKDSIRNTTVALGAMLGGSRIQWLSLVKGLLHR